MTSIRARQTQSTHALQHREATEKRIFAVGFADALCRRYLCLVGSINTDSRIVYKTAKEDGGRQSGVSNVYHELKISPEGR
jgi:hypothetical protein